MSVRALSRESKLGASMRMQTLPPDKPVRPASTDVSKPKKGGAGRGVAPPAVAAPQPAKDAWRDGLPQPDDGDGGGGDIAAQIQRGLAKIAMLDEKLEALGKKSRPRAGVAEEVPPEGAPETSLALVPVGPSGGQGPGADMSARLEAVRKRAGKGRMAVSPVAGVPTAAPSGPDAPTAGEVGAAAGAPAAAGAKKDFIARNAELATKKRNRKLTATEVARLRELLGPLLSDDSSSSSSSGSEGGEEADRAARRARRGRREAALRAADHDALVQLPPSVIVHGFAPDDDTRRRLDAVEGQLKCMVDSGTASEAAVNPYPQPLRLFPVFLTALESKVRV